MQKRLMATTGCAVVLALGLSACGGGGGSDARPQPIAPPPTQTSPPPPPPPEPSSVEYDTAEYRRSSGAAAAGAISAYEAGATGEGVKIAVIDTGINASLGEFSGKIDSGSRDVAGSRGLGDEDGHGTAVSAVAAAARDDSNMHGVAFDSTIVALRADQPGSCADTSEDGGCSFYDNALARGVDAARLAGAKVINMSLGGSTPSSTLLSAMQRAVNAGIVLVISAGNDGEDPKGQNADPFALVPAQTFPGQVIIAGSVGVATATGIDIDRISTFSNRAGSGAPWYLTALGYRVRAPGADGQNYLWSGTSFSAPVISGAAALLAQAFPNLSAREMIEILFTTADDLGASGTDSIYGRGRLNLESAFQPLGSKSLAGSEQEVDTASNGDLPAAAGDADAANGAMGVIILDGYDRAFALDLAATLQRAGQAKPLARALRGNTRTSSVAAGPVSVAMTIAERRDLPQGFALSKLGIGPEDARKARLVAGSAVARLDKDTAVALGFSESAKALERQLSGAEAGAFLIARDVAGDPGFAASRDASVALRRDLGPVSATLAAETGEVWQEVETSATGSPYRWTSLSLDRDFGKTWLSAGIGRLEEHRTLLGGRMGDVFGGGGSTTLFLDVEARRELGDGFSAGLGARRGWTDFAGGSFATGAYGVDLAKVGVLNGSDRLGFRLSQPLRIESGGFRMTMPTGYDYATGLADTSLTRFSLRPSGREVDAELSYSTVLGRGWLGGNLFARRQPGHIADADTDYGAAIRYTLGF